MSQLTQLGGSLALTWNNSRNATTDTFSNFNPSYQSNLTFSYTQPLLRGFQIDNTRQQLMITKINREISDLQLAATVAGTLAATRNAYWDLVFATEAVDVAQRFLELADRLVGDNRVRVEVGAMAAIDVIQAQVEAANRLQALTQAEGTRQNAELALKRLIVNGAEDPLWIATLTPTDRPQFVPEQIDPAAAVKRALESRTDIAQAREQLESNRVSLRYLRNQTLPEVELVTSYGVQGLGGTQLLRDRALGAARLPAPSLAATPMRSARSRTATIQPGTSR